jgi:peroxiredoxin
MTSIHPGFLFFLCARVEKGPAVLYIDFMRISIQVEALVLAVVLAASALEGGQFSPPAQRHGRKTAPADTLHRRSPASAQYGPYEFQLRTIDGETVRLSDFVGKVVVVNIWAPWCQPCRRETKGFAKLYERYQSRGLVILGVAIQTSESAVRSFAEECGIRWAVGIDDDILKTYDAVGLPDTYVFSPDGSLVKEFIGFTHEEVLRPLLESMLPR